MLHEKKIFAIGLMSGTSLDGVDLSYVSFDKVQETVYEILITETIPYSQKWKQTLQEAIAFSTEELQKLDVLYGQYLGKILQTFIEKYTLENVDFIASHGHTILHQPDKGITLQIGNGQEIASKIGKKVVCDFRTQDVLFGGQGAPLVPIGDALLFAKYAFCVNLGGFANVSFQQNKIRIAFDICPVNIVLNHYVEKLGFPFDDQGKIAAAGTIDTGLLQALNSLPFYQKEAPKSLGLEWVQATIFPMIDALKLPVSTVLKTFVEHVAMQIGAIIYKEASVLLTGGGVFNSYLYSRIEFYALQRLEKQDNLLVNYKEALVFAFLGLLRLEHRVNCLKSVTGASKDHSSGQVFMP